MSIKRLDPKAVFKVVSSHDPARNPKLEPVLDAKGNPVLDSNGKPKLMDADYDQFTETLDASVLQVLPGEKLTLFHVRPLLNMEAVELQAKYFSFNTDTRKVVNKNNAAMLIDIFNLACIGMEDDNGVVSKITADEIPMNVVIDIGAVINLISLLGKNLKKS